MTRLTPRGVAVLAWASTLGLLVVLALLGGVQR